jgi:serine/threonine protein kinase
VGQLKSVKSSLWTATLVLLTFSCAASTQGCPLYQEFLIPGILYSRSQQSTPTTSSTMLTTGVINSSSSSSSGSGTAHVVDCCLGECELRELIGKGGFGVVHRAVVRYPRHYHSNARSSKQQDSYAIKVIDKQALAAQSSELLVRLENEVNIHSQLKHPHIVEMYDCIQTESFAYLVLDLCAHGNMYKYLKVQGPLCELAAAHVSAQLLDALAYLHKQKQVLHRDLKLANILVSDVTAVFSARTPSPSSLAATSLCLLTVKLCDFGLSTQLRHPDEEQYTICGTPNYLSPEIIANTYRQAQQQVRAHSPTVSALSGLVGHTQKSDIWAAGVLLYSFLCGHAPFETSGQNAAHSKQQQQQANVALTLERAATGIFHLPAHISSETRDVLGLMLDVVIVIACSNFNSMFLTMCMYA